MELRQKPKEAKAFSSNQVIVVSFPRMESELYYPEADGTLSAPQCAPVARAK
jgi:hypothetical protein